MSCANKTIFQEVQVQLYESKEVKELRELKEEMEKQEKEVMRAHILAYYGLSSSQTNYEYSQGKFQTLCLTLGKPIENAQNDKSRIHTFLFYFLKNQEINKHLNLSNSNSQAEKIIN